MATGQPSSVISVPAELAQQDAEPSSPLSAPGHASPAQHTPDAPEQDQPAPARKKSRSVSDSLEDAFPALKRRAAQAPSALMSADADVQLDQLRPRVLKLLSVFVSLKTAQRRILFKELDFSDLPFKNSKELDAFLLPEKVRPVWCRRLQQTRTAHRGLAGFSH